jgi:hypothetical protein
MNQLSALSIDMETPLTPEQRDLARKILATEALEEARYYMLSHRREFVTQEYFYSWQHECFESTFQQTMVLAGNRTGKTMSAGYHTACDLTGDYPDWWTGFRFNFGPNFMVGGIDNIQLKNVVQKELFGDVTHSALGKKTFTGNWIHPSEIGRITWSKVTTDLAQSVEVIGKNGMGMCNLRSYSQGKTGNKSLTFAGTSLDGLWIDECPDDALIGQFVVRTMTGCYNKGGRIRYTMTPELGLTKLVANFMESRGKHQTLIGPVSWAQCPHLTLDVQEMMLDGIPEHEQDMRKKGVPMFGEGLVFPIKESRIKIPIASGDGAGLTSKSYLKYIRAIDLGINHPTAIVWLAFDPEIDCIYLLKCYAERGDAAAVHAAAANAYMEFAPIVFPHDIDMREKGSGKTLRRYYSEAGLSNSLDFKNKDGSIFVEPGIQELYDRMKTGRFKVVDTPENEPFFREMRQYHREDGKIVPLDDDVISAVRYGAMMITRYGVPMGGQRSRKPRVKSSFGG